MKITLIFDKVKMITVEQLGIDLDEYGTHRSYMKDFGADSLDMVELVMAAEEEFGIEIPDELAELMVTPKASIEVLDGLLNPKKKEPKRAPLEEPVQITVEEVDHMGGGSGRTTLDQSGFDVTVWQYRDGIITKIEWDLLPLSGTVCFVGDQREYFDTVGSCLLAFGVNDIMRAIEVSRHEGVIEGRNELRNQFNQLMKHQY